MKPLLIDSLDEFQKHKDVLLSEPLLAVDTEFFRETTYFPHLGLIQVANSKIVACIDPLAFDAHECVSLLLLNTEITKLFHSCSQDLEVLNIYLGKLPCPILDTQIASSLLSENEQIGYANLVEKELGVNLDKSQTRTNWLNRPLSKKQLEYAADDVYYLFQLYEKLLTKLETLGRKQWFLDDCNELCLSSEKYKPQLINCGKRVKGTHKLPGLELAIIDAIANWREQLAIAKDKTRRRVLPDDDIVRLAQSKPDTKEALSKTGQISRYLNSTEVLSLLSVLTDSYLIPKANWPDNTSTRPTPEERAKIKLLQDAINKKSEELGISSSVLCPRKELISLINGVKDCRPLTGWRRNEIGNTLLVNS